MLTMELNILKKYVFINFESQWVQKILYKHFESEICKFVFGFSATVQIVNSRIKWLP